jgi:hypothetical protein
VFYNIEERPAIRDDRSIYPDDWYVFDSSFCGKTPLALMLVDNLDCGDTIDNLCAANMNSIELLSQKKTQEEIAELAKTSKIPLYQDIDYSWTHINELIAIARQYLTKRAEMKLAHKIIAEQPKRNEPDWQARDPQLLHINSAQLEQAKLYKEQQAPAQKELDPQTLAINTRVAHDINYTQKHEVALANEAVPQRIMFNYNDINAETNKPQSAERTLAVNEHGEYDFVE